MAPRTKQEPAAIEDEDNATIPEPEGWRTWLGRQQALATIGCDKARFRQLIDDGILIEYRAPDGSIRFLPESVKRAQEEQFWVEPSPREMSGPGVSVGGVAIKSVEQNIDLVKILCGHLDKTQAHYTTAMDYVLRTFSNAIEFQSRTITELRGQLSRQTTEFRKGDLERLEAETEAKVKLAAEDRKTLMVAELVPRLAPLAGYLTEATQDALGRKVAAKSSEVMPPEAPQAPNETPDAPQEPPAQSATGLADVGAQLLRSFGPEKLALFRDSGVLEEHEQQLVDRAIGAMQEKNHD